MRVYAPNKTWLIHEFDSLDDFADSLERYGIAGHRYGDDAALQMARVGWEAEMPEALRIVEACTEKMIRERLIEPAFAPLHDVSGAVVDVGRYMAGEPECMIGFPPRDLRGKPVISIVTCMSLGAVSQAELLAQGRAVCALVMAIEATGRNVEVWSDNVTGFHRQPYYNSPVIHGWGKAHTVKVLVKGGNDYLDPARLMFALCNYGMGRTLGDAIFPRLGKVDPKLEKSWAAAYKSGRAAPCCPNPDFYPEGSLIMPAPRGSLLDFMRGGQAANDDGLWLGDYEVSDASLEATVAFVMEKMRELGLVEKG